MKGKTWYSISIKSNGNYEKIASIKSKGLAFAVLKLLQTIYKKSDTVTEVVMQ